MHPGYSQTHVVLGYPIASLREDYHAGVVAAALFGEGMSSPLMDEIRERRGLVYYASCSADVGELAGQFVIEASTSPEQLDEFLVEVQAPARDAGASIRPADLERARKQIAVRTLRDEERPSRRLEDAALDLFVHGRVRGRAELHGARARRPSARCARVRAAAGDAGGGRDRRPRQARRERARARAVRLTRRAPRAPRSSRSFAGNVAGGIGIASDRR